MIISDSRVDRAYDAWNRGATQPLRALCEDYHVELLNRSVLKPDLIDMLDKVSSNPAHADFACTALRDVREKYADTPHAGRAEQVRHNIALSGRVPTTVAFRIIDESLRALTAAAAPEPQAVVVLGEMAQLATASQAAEAVTPIRRVLYYVQPDGLYPNWELETKMVDLFRERIGVCSAGIRVALCKGAQPVDGALFCETAADILRDAEAALVAEAAARQAAALAKPTIIPRRNRTVG